MNKIFESFHDFIVVGQPIIKRKNMLISYEQVDTLLSDDGRIMIDDNTVYSFFEKNVNVKESQNLTSINSFYFFEDLLTIPPGDAVNITKGIREIFDELSTLKHPHTDFENYFKQAYNILRKNTTKKYRVSLDGTREWLHEAHNNSKGLKELSVYTNIPPKQLGYIFDIKYIYVLAMISKKLSKGIVNITTY